MILGVDVGGTYLRYELRKGSKSVKKATLKSSEIGLATFLDSLLKKEQSITSIYISYAGQVRDGRIITAPNITIDKENIQAYIEEKYEVELLIENDLNCAVLAESQAYDTQNIAALFVGSGLGLGIISDSVLLRGFENIATELGHIPFQDAPFFCSCGKRNCMELYASGSGVLKWKQYYKLDESFSLQALCKNKRKDAQKIYRQFIEALLYAVGTTITLFNSEILVLGGGIIKNNPDIYKEISRRIKNYAMPLSLQNMKIVCSQFENSSLEGAFLLKEKRCQIS